jgi:hypothetical protein
MKKSPVHSLPDVRQMALKLWQTARFLILASRVTVAVNGNVGHLAVSLRNDQYASLPTRSHNRMNLELRMMALHKEITS